MNRRDFFRILGASTGAALATACDQKVANKLVSQIAAPKVLPGEAEFVRSTCRECPAGCGVLAKVRDGRPIKLEGDPDHPLNRGALCMRGQAALSRVYHPSRLRTPQLRSSNGEFQSISWDEAFAILNGALGKNTVDRRHVFLSERTTGSASGLIDDFCQKRNIERLPEFELYSQAAVRQANALVFGRHALPIYSVKEADLLITFGADVIETFLNPVQFAQDLAAAKLKWIHVEPHLSLTGINADERLVVRAGSEAWLLAFLAGELGITADQAAEQTGLKPERISELANRLKHAQHPLVIAGGTATATENGALAAVCAAILQQTHRTPLTWADDDHVGSLTDIAELEQQLAAGKVSVAFFNNVDPVSYRPTFGVALGKAAFRVGFGDSLNATLAGCDLVLPLSHALEIDGAVQPFGNTQSLSDILAKLGATARPPRSAIVSDAGDIRGFLANSKLVPAGRPERTLIITPSIRTYDGRSADLPLLSEIPDPLTTVTYGAWITVSEPDAKSLGLKDGSVVDIAVGGKNFQLPARLMPAQPTGVFTVQRPFLQGATLPITAAGEELAVWPITTLTVPAVAAVALPFLSGGMHAEGRGIVPGLEHKHDQEHEHTHEPAAEHVNKTLYPKHEHKNYRWGMAIDLERCTGCGACVAACYVENNIPLVGRDEHVAGREMAWLRIEPFVNETGEFEMLPMMCQQCDNAPCEPVCPVNATYHNPEGLNAQVYNRCVGTRYCSNNCPYKVRRFNWIDHPVAQPLDLMFNPDVSKRPKGVMEKCTFCVQRVVRAKDHAKDEQRLVHDGEVTTACAQTCPAQAIVFGNMLDETSQVYRASKSERTYRALEELGVEPAVYYLKAQRES